MTQTGAPVSSSKASPDALPSGPSTQSRGKAEVWAWRLLVPALIFAGGLLAAAVVIGNVTGGDPEGRGLYSPHPAAGLIFLLVGGAIVPRQPRNPVGWLLVAIGLLIGTVAAAASFAGNRALFWMNQWLPATVYGLIPISLLLFPDGRLTSPRWRAALGLGAAGLVIGVTPLAWASWKAQGILFQRPEQLSSSVRNAFLAAQLGTLMIFATAGLAVISLVLRRHSSAGDIRKQINVLALGAVLLPIGVILAVLNVPGADMLLDTAVPLAVGAAILKYHLFDIDLFLNRSMVYGALTVLLALVYAGLATAGGGLLGDGWGSPLLATAVVALAFHPLRSRLQRGVNRLMYGESDDPYAAVSRLTKILEPAVEPETLLPLVAETIIEALGVPFAEMEIVDSKGARRTVAATGRPVLDTEEFPMVHNGRRVGFLRVSPRTVGSSFTRREIEIIESMARQAGVAVHAMQLTDDLKESRTRLIHAREEERRRLRNDLHDGVGPVLAGAAMQVGAVRRVPDEELDETLDKLEAMMQACIGEIRQIVEGLRPASLDALGLVEAIRHRARMYSQAEPAPQIRIKPGKLPGLPAALEVAAFRIATEAVTNVVRHAGAKRCEVRVYFEEELVVEVSDDGRGLPHNYLAGIGLRSMRERAEELGGSFEVSSSSEGTRIVARLPVPGR